MRTLLLCLCCLALNACTGVPVVTHDFCVLAKQICVSKKDALTDGTAKQILDHNKGGASTCGWKPDLCGKAKQ